MIPREVIDEITYRCNIEDVISSYVTLKRAGSNFNGVCPFHSEKTPSFTVFPTTKSFYCFGCGAGGDVISFVMRAENVDYPSAIELLAAKVGITIPQNTEIKPNDVMSRKRTYEMNLEAAKFFRSCLYDEKLGVRGREYFASRRLSGATVKHFGLGYAPEGFGMLTDHMHKKGFSDEELIAGFLCGKSQKTGRAYDYFRNRVMFPIIDTQGNIIAFGGRVLDDSKPKYLNSSDTPGFKKSRNLFALNYAKDACSEQMILCEGYMDVIALHQAGFTNAVATLGTAITSEQARIMSKYTKKVIISYDSDEAGQRAANKAMSMLGAVGVEVRVLKMDGAKDPDEYIKKFGPDRFRMVLGNSRTSFDYKSEAVYAKYDVGSPGGKIKASEELCEIVSSYESGVEREVYISQISERLGLPSEAIKNDVERLRRKMLREIKKQESREAYNQVKNYGDRTNPDAAKNVRANAAEETIIGLLLDHPEHRSAILTGKVDLSVDYFYTALGKRVFGKIIELEATDEGFSYSVLISEFNEDEKGRIERCRQKRRELTENGTDVLKESAATLKREKMHKDETESGDKFASLNRKKKDLADKKQHS